jgi:YHS domain-containing protein
MKKETKCKCCDIEISEEGCQLATLTTEIDGKTYTFCCQNCADKFEEGKQEKK